MLADLDLTEVAVVVEYACGHVDSQLITSETLTTSSLRYEDGVLYIPTACAACLELVDVPAGAELPFGDDDPFSLGPRPERELLLS